MGTFRINIEIGDSSGSRYHEVHALVDTGASYSQIPAAVLRELGVSPHTRRTFILADGRRVERDVGRTWIRVNGSSEITLVIFGQEGSEPVLGAVSLEELGLAVDSLNERVVPVDGLLITSD